MRKRCCLPICGSPVCWLLSSREQEARGGRFSVAIIHAVRFGERGAFLPFFVQAVGMISTGPVDQASPGAVPMRGALQPCCCFLRRPDAVRLDDDLASGCRKRRRQGDQFTRTDCRPCSAPTPGCDGQRIHGRTRGDMDGTVRTIRAGANGIPPLAWCCTRVACVSLADDHRLREPCRENGCGR